MFKNSFSNILTILLSLSKLFLKNHDLIKYNHYKVGKCSRKSRTIKLSRQNFNHIYLLLLNCQTTIRKFSDKLE